MLKVKLGKGPKKSDTRTLKLGNYLKTSELPALPAAFSWTDKVPSWGTMLNTDIGDCTIAAAGHMVALWTAANGSEYMPPDADILTAYEAISGYVPGNENTDSGCVELDVLAYWKKTGISGHTIGAYAEIVVSRLDLIKYAVCLFGGCYIGLQLPRSVSAEGTTSWKVPPEGTTGDGAVGSWGGHAVMISAFDDNAKQFTVITWGNPMPMDYDFFETYGEESYGILSCDFVTGAKPSPSGFDLAALQADLNEL